MLSSLLEGGVMFAPKLEFSFSSVLYLELFKIHHCLPDPGGKCCRSDFHAAASTIQFLHFVAPPTLKTPLFGVEEPCVAFPSRILNLRSSALWFS